LFLRYYLSNDIAVRLGFGITSNTSKLNEADSALTGAISSSAFFPLFGGFGLAQTFSTASEKTTQLAFTFSPGIEKHFKGTDKLDPYVGAQIKLSILSKQTQTNSYFASQDNAGSLETLTIDQTIETPGGLNFGLGIFSGFNYFFANNIAIGAEARWMFNTTSVGGDITNTATSTSDIGGTVTTTNTSSPSTNKTSTSGLAATTFGGAVTLTFFFNK